mgnify:FL=1|tara:strand:- start:1075 stop:2484 length:1410 start_codon:yes stop_codon:yes gene_type:complete
MSVNLNNTIFYTGNNTNMEYYNDYVAKKLNKDKFKRIIVRCFSEDYDKIFNEDFKCSSTWIGLCPPKTNNDISKVKHYQFTEMDFKDDKCKDNIYHSFSIILPLDDIETVSSYLIAKFTNTQYINMYSTNNVGSFTIMDTYKIEQPNLSGKKYIDKTYATKYPINILSLGRYTNDTGLTHRLLCKMKIYHHLWVEDFEFEKYGKWFNPTYCCLHNTGVNYSEQKMGSKLVRNCILEFWETEAEHTPKKIWMLDDNISSYKRLNNGKKTKYEGAKIFTSIENYTEDIPNVKLCSHNFNPFVNGTGSRRIIIENEKHYSSLLISLGTGLRFKSKYNEDIIFSIENVLEGYNTLCFNHILYDKPTSGFTSGGNQQIYKNHTDQGYSDKWVYTWCFLNMWVIENKLKFKKEKNLDTFWEKKWLLSIEPENRDLKLKTKLGHNCNYNQLDIEYKNWDKPNIENEEHKIYLVEDN